MDFQNARLICVTADGEFSYSDVRDNDTFVTICADAPLYLNPVAGTAEFNNADVQPRGLVNDGLDQIGPVYPELCPVRRTLTPGEYPVRRFTATNGAGRTRIYGSKAYDATLQLEYLLNDNELALLLGNYHEAKGGYNSLTLNAEVFAGISAPVMAQIPDYLKWRYAETPVVDSLLPGRSRVTVNLVATLDD
jgi:hypothetical protein